MAHMAPCLGRSTLFLRDPICLRLRIVRRRVDSESSRSLFKTSQLLCCYPPISQCFKVVECSKRHGMFIVDIQGLTSKHDWSIDMGKRVIFLWRGTLFFNFKGQRLPNWVCFHWFSYIWRLVFQSFAINPDEKKVSSPPLVSAKQRCKIRQRTLLLRDVGGGNFLPQVGCRECRLGASVLHNQVWDLFTKLTLR